MNFKTRKPAANGKSLCVCVDSHVQTSTVGTGESKGQFVSLDHNIGLPSHDSEIVTVGCAIRLSLSEVISRRAVPQNQIRLPPAADCIQQHHQNNTDLTNTHVVNLH